MRHEMWIPHWRPTALNRLMYAQVRQRIALKRNDAEMVRGYALQLGIPLAQAKRRVSLQIVLEGRQQQGDIDAYLKTTLDALVSARLLLGDREGDCEWAGVTYSRDGQAGTRITLEDLP